jgi:hypothetical protein
MKMEQKQKLLSIRIRTMGDKPKKAGKKYYKSLNQAIAHCDRSEKMDANYLIRPELQHLNIVNYQNPEGMVEEVLQEHQDFYKRKLPKNWKPYIDGLITFSDTMFDDLKKYGREKMNEVAHDFLKSEFGDNLIGMALHVDETTPHFHFHAINYNTKEHKAYSAFMEKEIKENNGSNPLQDRLADYFKANIDDFEYVRGQAMSIKDYHNKRKFQHDHIEQQAKVIDAQNNKIDEQLETIKRLESEKDDAIAKKKEFRQMALSTELKLKKLKEDYAEVVKGHYEQITDIVDTLVELGREKDGGKFLRLINRYVRSEDVARIDKLITKWNGALAKASEQHAALNQSRGRSM